MSRKPSYDTYEQRHGIGEIYIVQLLVTLAQHPVRSTQLTEAFSGD